MPKFEFKKHETRSQRSSKFTVAITRLIDTRTHLLFNRTLEILHYKTMLSKLERLIWMFGYTGIAVAGN